MSDGVVQTLTSLPPLVYVVTGLATLLYFQTRRRSSLPSNVPPFPVRPMPLVGHIPMLRGDLLEIMHGWRQSVGDIFSFYVGPRLFVAMNSYEIIKEALVKKADYFSDRPDILLLEHEKKTGGEGIIFNSGPTWKEQRSVSISIMRNFGMGKDWLAEKINEEVESYLDELAKLKGQPTDIRLLTNTSVANVICAILIGNRFELDDPYLKRLLYLLNIQVSLANGLSPVHSFPWLKYLPGDLFNNKRVLRNRNEIIEHFSVKFVSDKEDPNLQDAPDCFINAYYSKMKQKLKAGQSTTLDKKNLIRVITNLFAAGSETTSTTLLWAMLYAMHYPQCQEKINKEIENVIGFDRLPNIQDKPKMNYLNAFIMESQRLGSIVPFSIFHHCSKTVEVGGYTIPKDAVIIPNLDEVLKDAKTWGDPLVFRPERFFDKDNKIVIPEEFIPFSIGRRFCMGEALAKSELFIFMAGLFQRFHVRPEDPDNLPVMEPIVGITRGPKSFKVKFIEKMEQS